MKKAILLITLTATAIISCNQNKEIEIKQADEQMVYQAKGLDVKVDNKIDPVCEMDIDQHLSDTIHYAGKIYGFCSSGCKETFAQNPETFLSKLNSEK